MKKTIITVAIISLIILLTSIYKFNFTRDDIFVENSKGEYVKYDDRELNRASIVKVENIVNDLYFDKKTSQWKDSFGICHTCTPENGFNLDGTIDTSDDE